jgi:hypothetical protein
MFQPKLDSRGACAVLQTLLKISGRWIRKIRPIWEKFGPFHINEKCRVAKGLKGVIKGEEIFLKNFLFGYLGRFEF